MIKAVSKSNGASSISSLVHLRNSSRLDAMHEYIYPEDPPLFLVVAHDPKSEANLYAPSSERSDNPISKGFENLTKLWSLDVVVETLAQHVLHVKGVTSDQIVHIGEPWPFELPRATIFFNNVSVTKSWILHRLKNTGGETKGSGDGTDDIEGNVAPGEGVDAMTGDGLGLGASTGMGQKWL
ncbi:unnamed protein product [Sphenostylis stenocarpa]|uniref:Uncharacterized protein n=1 Tax=Sphenostylis stenocarpa TaxID=92480 RepID=A0AA86T015_9FABA|nr:unnamed protein product [Sphenostylis stenocarpa]